MTTNRLGGSALATQTLPGVHVFSENSPSFTRDCRPLQGPRYEPQFRRQIERIHGLGPYVLSCLLEAIAAGADLRTIVTEFAELDSGFIASYGGNAFPVELRAIDGERP
jgi:hypothetical protein